MAVRWKTREGFAADPMPAPLSQIHGEALLRLPSLPHFYSSFSSFNNCSCGSGRPGLGGFLFSGRRGDGLGWGCFPGWCGSGARRGSSGTASWSTSSAALRRSQAVLPSTHIAEGRLLRALSPACRRHLFVNLLASAPQGRPFFCSSMAVPSCTVPSGIVPGDGADGRAWRFRGGEGPDRFFLLYFRVLFAYCEGLVVIFVYFVVLSILCNPTAQINGSI